MNYLPDNIQQLLRENNIIKDNEVASVIGDVYVAINVIGIEVAGAISMLLRDVPCLGTTSQPCGRWVVSYVIDHRALREPVPRRDISTSWLIPGLILVTVSGDCIKTA